MCGSRGAATRRPSLFRMVGEKMFKSAKPAVVSAWAAHGLAWIAGIFLAFGPVYSGSSSSLVEKNGLYVIWLLLVPVLLTGIVVLAVRRADISQMRRFLLLWGSTMLLLVLCAVSILSIGCSTCRPPLRWSSRRSPILEVVPLRREQFKSEEDGKKAYV